MSNRIIVRIWLPEAGANEPVEGHSGRVYGFAKRHPSKPGYIFPGYQDSDEAHEKWIREWDAGANRDIFEAIRRWGFPIPVAELWEPKEAPSKPEPVAADTPEPESEAPDAPAESEPDAPAPEAGSTGPAEPAPTDAPPRRRGRPPKHK